MDQHILPNYEDNGLKQEHYSTDLGRVHVAGLPVQQVLLIVITGKHRLT